MDKMYRYNILRKCAMRMFGKIVWLFFMLKKFAKLASEKTALFQLRGRSVTPGPKLGTNILWILTTLMIFFP